MDEQCRKDWRPRPLDERCLSVQFYRRHRCILDANHKPPCNCACGIDRFTLKDEHDRTPSPS